MKRSKKIEISPRFTSTVGQVATALALSTSFALAGCESPPDTTAYTYKSEQACVAAGVFTPKACHDGSANALATYNSTAPRFESKQDCLDAYGQDGCRSTTTSNGGSSWVPMYIGYMMGQNSANNSGARSFSTTPIYRSSGGGYATANGADLGSNAFSRAASTSGVKTYSSGMSRPSPAGFQSHSNVVSRGGFGSTGRGMSMGS